MTTWEHAIERRIVTPQAAYAGLHERDIAMLEQHDYGNLEALVRYRTHDADDRAILTVGLRNTCDSAIMDWARMLQKYAQLNATIYSHLVRRRL